MDCGDHAGDVRRWLEVATKGICQEDKERIEEEISAHYEDVLRDALQQGSPKNEAHLAAMESLGSPRKAGRGFRRSCLTEHEAKWFQWVTGPTPWWVFLMFMPFVLSSGRDLAYRASSDLTALLCTTAFASGTALWVFVWRWAAPRVARLGRFRTCLPLRLLSVLFFALPLAVIPQYQRTLSSPPVMFACACTLLCIAATSMLAIRDLGRIGRKLRGFPSTRRPGRHPG
jgi:hypothetical protein